MRRPIVGAPGFFICESKGDIRAGDIAIGWYFGRSDKELADSLNAKWYDWYYPITKDGKGRIVLSSLDGRVINGDWSADGRFLVKNLEERPEWGEYAP